MIPEPTKSAACEDPPRPPPIDVVALSVGRPDGVYYAGKRFHRVSEDDRRTYREGNFDGRQYLGVDARRLHIAIGQRLATSTMVVRWEVIGGHPGAPKTLTVESSDGVTPKDERVFDWGEGGYSIYDLGHALARNAWCDEVHDSSNEYIEDMDKIVAPLPDEWVLSRAEIRGVIFCRYLANEAVLMVDRARLAGVTVEQLVEGISQHIVRVSMELALERGSDNG